MQVGSFAPAGQRAIDFTTRMCPGFDAGGFFNRSHRLAKPASREIFGKRGHFSLGKATPGRAIQQGCPQAPRDRALENKFGKSFRLSFQNARMVDRRQNERRLARRDAGLGTQKRAALEPLARGQRRGVLAFAESPASATIVGRAALAPPLLVSTLRRTEALVKPLAHRLPVMALQILIRDLRDGPVEPLFAIGALLGRFQRRTLDLALEQHLHERPRLFERGAQRFRALRTQHVVGILPARQEGKAQRLARPDMRQREVDAAIGGAQAGLVAVEAEDRLWRDPPDHRKLLFRQRCAERRNDMGKPRPVQCDGIDIALDHEQRAGIVRRLAGPVEVVERRSLVKDRCFRRIQILRLRIFRERAATERDHPALRIRDREHHAIPEAIVGDRVILELDQQPGLHHHLNRHILAGEKIAQSMPVVRRVTDAESLCDLADKPSPGQILPRIATARAFQFLPEVGHGQRHRVIEADALLLADLDLRRRDGERNARLARQPLDGLHEAEALYLHQEGEDVAVAPGGEIEPRLLLVVDEKGGAALGVEG